MLDNLRLSILLHERFRDSNSVIITIIIIITVINIMKYPCTVCGPACLHVLLAALLPFHCFQ